MKDIEQLPRMIRVIDEFDGSVKILKVEDLPDRQRFVFLNQAGIEVDSSKEAAERIPIEEVHIISTDGNGHLVSKDQALRIHIKEYGAEKRLLRSTTMTPNRP